MGDTWEGARAWRERRPCDSARVLRERRQRAEARLRLCFVRDVARLGFFGLPRLRELAGWSNVDAQVTDPAHASVSTQTVQAKYFEMSVDMCDIDTEYAVSALVDPVQVSRVARKFLLICRSFVGLPFLDSCLDLSLF